MQVDYTTISKCANLKFYIFLRLKTASSLSVYLSSVLHRDKTDNAQKIDSKITTYEKLTIWQTEFFNLLSREIQRNSASISLFGKRLKNSFFLSQIYSLLSYIHFLFPFFSLLLKITQFSFSKLNSHGVTYSSRKPILYKPPASI